MGVGIPFQYQDPLSLHSLDLWKRAKLYPRFLQNKPSSALNGTSKYSSPLQMPHGKGTTQRHLTWGCSPIMCVWFSFFSYLFTFASTPITAFLVPPPLFLFVPASYVCLRPSGGTCPQHGPSRTLGTCGVASTRFRR